MRRSRLGFARANSLRPVPLLQLLLTGALALGAGVIGHDFNKDKNTVVTAINAAPAVIQQAAHSVAASSPAQALASAGADIATAIAPKPENVSREAELDEGQTFADLLEDAGLQHSEALAAMNALSRVYDLRRLKAGQDVTLSFSRTVQSETFTGAVFEPEATKEIHVVRGADGTYAANIATIPVVRQRVAARAEITSSLRDAAEKAGIPHAIMASLIHIYSHEIDFQRDIHNGDKFEVLYDQPMTRNGKPVGEGSIIYATMQVGEKTKPVYRVTFSDGTVDYFDEKGHSVRRTLLRTPVAAAHITSGFGMRIHPILGYSKMHKGVDFGAATGTPIFAAGTGTVEEVGYKGSYGRYIRIRHNGQLATAYAHMSRFASSMYRGAHVTQGQVIGYVGMSGRATGPHLHFETIVNGQQVNPMSVNLPTGRVLEGKLLVQFKQGEGRIRQEFSSLLNKKAAEAPAPAVTSAVTPAQPLTPAAATTQAFPAQQQTSCGSKTGC